MGVYVWVSFRNKNLWMLTTLFNIIAMLQVFKVNYANFKTILNKLLA